MMSNEEYRTSLVVSTEPHARIVRQWGALTQEALQIEMLAETNENSKVEQDTIRLSDVDINIETMPRPSD